jgi:hydroxyacid-oxoacid transhydrogenase
MDTGKVAAIFAANRDAQLWDYTTQPFGRGALPKQPMLPLICIPTTAGTGSEMTTVAIFDLHDRGVKTGLRLR